jgi:hypothetical protein
MSLGLTERGGGPLGRGQPELNRQIFDFIDDDAFLRIMNLLILSLSQRFRTA